MKTDVEICGPDHNLAAASRLWDADIGCLPVVSTDRRVVVPTPLLVICSGCGASERKAALADRQTAHLF